MELNTIDFNVRPIQNANLSSKVWTLACTKGELFDFIVIPSEAEISKYSTWRQEKQSECVLECNYDHDLGQNYDENSQKMLVLINQLKQKHQVEYDDDCESEDQDASNHYQARQN